MCTSILVSYFQTKREEVQRAVEDAVDTGCQHLHYGYMYVKEYEVAQDIQQKIKE